MKEIEEKLKSIISEHLLIDKDTIDLNTTLGRMGANEPDRYEILILLDQALGTQSNMMFAMTMQDAKISEIIEHFKNKLDN